MRKTARLLMPVLLLLSVVPLFLAQPVMSQQFRTLTSYTTATVTSPSLEYYSQATTMAQTVGFTGTFTLTYRFVTGRYSCLLGVAPFPYNITGSQTIRIDYSSDVPTDFYFLNALNFYLWTQSNPCNPIGYPTLGPISKFGVTSGSYSASVNQLNNPYSFIFVYRGSGALPKLHVAVNGVQLQVPTFVTFANTHMITATRTSTHYTTVQVSFMEANAKWLLPLAIVVIVAALLLVTWPRKKGRK